MLTPTAPMIKHWWGNLVGWVPLCIYAENFKNLLFYGKSSLDKSVAILSFQSDSGNY